MRMSPTIGALMLLSLAVLKIPSRIEGQELGQETKEASILTVLRGFDNKASMDPILQDERALPFMERGLQAQKMGRHREALRHYKHIFKKFPNSSFSPEALFQTGKIHMDRTRWKKAFSAYQTVIMMHPDYRDFNLVIANQFETATALMEGRNLRYLFVFPFKNYDAAALRYEVIVRNAPFSEYAPLSLMNVAMIHRKRHKVNFAADALDRLINNYPTSMLAPDANLMLAETLASNVDGPLYDQGYTQEAISYFEDFLIQYPDSPSVARGETGLAEMREVFAKSKLLLGEYYYKHRKNYSAATVYFNEAITASPDSPSALKAREFLTRIEARPQVELAQKSSRRKPGRFLFFGRKKQKVPTPAIVLGQPSSAAPELAETEHMADASPATPAETENSKTPGSGPMSNIWFWKKKQAVPDEKAILPNSSKN